jgi:uncharacterized glyoxalase superfamily protein PhnB
MSIVPAYVEALVAPRRKGDDRAAMSFVPYFVYRDGEAALDWLTRAFGFEVVTRVPGEDGALLHAELRHGDAYMMVGTATPAQKVTTPWDLPRGHGVYVAVDDDLDARHARAVAAGATIIEEPVDTGLGTRRFRALDLDGYEWSFGTYVPGAPS